MRQERGVPNKERLITCFLDKIIYGLLHYLVRLTLSLSPWHLKTRALEPGNMIIILAPHTSYWDGFWAFVSLFATKTHCHFLVWHEHYNKITWLYDLLGGIPVDEYDSDVVNTLHDCFSRHDDFKLFLCPEGGLQPRQSLVLQEQVPTQNQST